MKEIESIFPMLACCLYIFKVEEEMWQQRFCFDYNIGSLSLYLFILLK